MFLGHVLFQPRSSCIGLGAHRASKSGGGAMRGLAWRPGESGCRVSRDMGGGEDVTLSVSRGRRRPEGRVPGAVRRRHRRQ